MKKYKNDRKNIETEIPDIPMKKKRDHGTGEACILLSGGRSI